MPIRIKAAIGLVLDKAIAVPQLTSVAAYAAAIWRGTGVSTQSCDPVPLRFDGIRLPKQQDSDAGK
ncbi:hypothetical protein GCM10027419_51540 [Pandoraea terrae]